jgi:hypothetical protein
VHTIKREKLDLCIEAFKKVVELYYMKNGI